ncbi:MAG: hypothetical protein M3Q22_07355 [Actinomycetota bacterium]|nr:hypothetical protein [Actinomycetota bacterium]
MTASDQPTSSAARPRTLRDDLLDDLRQAAPMPPPPPPRAVLEDAVPGERITDQSRAGSSRTPTLELRVTPTRWWGLRIKTLGNGPGLVIGAGPVQLSLTGFSR